MSIKGLWPHAYAWQDFDFLKSQHPVKRHCARWRGFYYGMTICNKYSFYEHPCVFLDHITRSGSKVKFR